MNIIAVKVTRAVVEREYAHVTPVVNIVASHDWLGVILYPDASQGIATDFIVLVETLCVIRDVKTNVLAVRYVASPNDRLSTRPANTNSSTNCK